ncbi:Anthranilate synthase, aminase component, partial [hydrothermal vent metagenome]
MNPEQFEQLAKEGYNRIPVTREVLADLDTPLSTYLKLASGPYSYLFESVQGGEKWGRYSIIGLPCRTVLRVYGQRIELRTDGKLVEETDCDDPLQWIEDFQQRFRAPDLDGLPRFGGGLVGYFGYDTVRYIEPRLKTGGGKVNPATGGREGPLGDKVNPATGGREGPLGDNDTLQTPDILLMVSDEVVVFDNLSGKLVMVVHVDATRDDAWA